MLPEIYAGCAERRNPDMAIFHYTVKIVGRSKGKSVISASAYLNGDVMKNEETGRISYYTSKKEVVYTSLMMCENAPPEWQIVPEENIKRFQKSVPLFLSFLLHPYRCRRGNSFLYRGT